MTAQIQEKPNSPEPTINLENPSVVKRYVVWGTANELEVSALVAATSPLFGATIQGPILIRKTIRVKPQPKALTVWDAEVEYRLGAKPDTGLVRWTVETTGGTAHMDYAISRTVYPASGVPDPGLMVGVEKSGDKTEIKGVDVTVPVFNWTETWRFLPGAVYGTSYLWTLAYLTGKVNSTPFRAFAPGEVLFLGVDGGAQTQGGNANALNPELTFKFSGSPNVSGATVAGITGVSKLGWEYLWILRKDVPDTVAYWGLIPTPLAVVVNQMYPYVPFAGLGIG